ncbi:hypothetical protein GCM10022254_37850 [Actinomadura meridiana]|uniref:Uncharacterized protein n=1 Tax=Actinomadura meridiana TaxID=559626 RepID=A0ABP8C5H3_9ACTN
MSAMRSRPSKGRVFVRLGRTLTDDVQPALATLAGEDGLIKTGQACEEAAARRAWTARATIVADGGSHLAARRRARTHRPDVG